MKKKSFTFYKVLKLFDFFKEGFSLIKSNKVLFKPQVILIIIKAVLWATIGTLIYFLMNTLENDALNHTQFSATIASSIGLLALFIIVLLVLFIAKLILEPGLYYMYTEVIYKGSTTMKDFWIGVKKFFWKFFLGDLLLSVFWIIAALPLFIVSAITLMIAGSLVLIAYKIFSIVWKYSLVLNNKGVIEAFKDSILFGKKHFIPLALLIIIKDSFLMSSSKPSALGYQFGNIGNVAGVYGEKLGTPYQLLDVEKIFEIIKIVILILIPVITIASVVGALISMILSVFFILVMGIAYKDDFKNESQNELDQESEVIHDELV